MINGTNTDEGRKGRAQELKGSRAQEFKCSRVQELKGSRVEEHGQSRTRGFGYWALGILLVVCGLLSAQPEPASASLSEAPVFKYYVWGQVRQPGAYRLGTNPDIVELLSAGGGPTDQADISHVVLVRGIDQKRVPLNLKEVIGSGKPVPLTPGDVVIVPRAFWYTFRDELAIVTSLAIFVNLYFTIANGVKK
jgi:hypothetical protein